MKILSVFISFIPSLIFCFFFYKKKSFFKFIIISILLYFLYISLFTNKTVIENLAKLTEFRISYIFKFYILTFIDFIITILLSKFFELKKEKTEKSNISYLIIVCICFPICFALILLQKLFPLDNPANIFYTLHSPVTGGIPQNLFQNIILQVLLPSLFFIVFFIIINKNFFSKYNFTFKSKLIKISVSQLVSIYLIILTFGSFIFRAQLYNYPKLFYNYNKKPVDSEFYKTEYVNPNNNVITNKKNVIYIFLESMETSFASYEEGGLLKENHIPNLTKLALENKCFNGNTNKLNGITQTDGTSWTIAGILSKISGLPYNMQQPANFDNLVTYLPNAVMLTDILHSNKYNQVFAFGSEKSFGAMDLLLETHGDIEVHDINWYKNKGYINKEYHNGFWGFEDKYLYEFAKKDLIELSTKEEPFFYGIDTIDTHFQEGFICSECQENHPNQRFFDVLECADRQIGQFINWLKQQSFYDNTLIVISGDHLFMSTTLNLFEDEYENNIRIVDEVEEKHRTKESKRKVYCCFINSKNTNTYHNYNSYDIYATILDELDVPLQNNKAGFGVNLNSNNQSINEKYSFKFVNEKTMEKNIQYMALEQN